MNMFGKSLTMMIIVMTVVGCTLAITLIHTEGLASDVVDDTESATPNISMTPISPGKFIM